MPEPKPKTPAVTPADVVESPERPKPQVPDHELIRKIGSGAYGEVWLAKNVVGTYRAVKIVYRDSFKDERPYEREYRGIQKFEPISRSNDGFVDILQIGRNDEQGNYYYVMELADDATPPVAAEVTRLTSKFEIRNPKSEIDQSLLTSAATQEQYVPKTLRSEIQKRGRLPFEECLQFSLSLNLALGHLHRQGLIHRDIKPSNIIFVGGVPKLADIGLVTDVEEARSFVGTEGFVAPEGPNSPQADIYSLGKVLYEMSMGKDRTEFPEPFTALGQTTGSQDLEELNAVILKACATNPRDRYQSAEDMHVDLALLQSGKSVKSRRMLERRLAFARKAGAVVGVAASVAVAAFLYQQFQTREARRLAQENERLASQESAARARAEGLLDTLQSKEAEHFFAEDDANKGTAYLAHLLRQNPTNEIVASRLISALTDRSFALPLRTFQNGGTFQGAEFHPDGRQFVAWGRNGTNAIAQVWDVETGKTVGQAMLHSTNVVQARFSPDGRLIATIAADGTARIWDAATGASRGATLRHSLPPAISPIISLNIQNAAFSPDGKLLVMAGGNEARVWNVATGELLTPPLDHGARIWDVGFSPDGKCIATSGKRMTKLWNSASGVLKHILDNGDGDTACRAQFSPDRRRIVTSGGFLVRVWDVETGERLLHLQHGAVVSSAHFSPDGSQIVTAEYNRAARIWDAETGHALPAQLMHGSEVLGAQFDWTGQRVLTWEPRRARVWDARTGQPLTEWMLHSADIQSAQFSPDGNSVLTATPDTAILWDVRPGRAANIALRNFNLVPSARFSPDGTRVVTATGGNVYSWGRNDKPWEAAVWDAQTGELASPLIAASGGIQSAEFSPDGRKIVTACLNGEAQVWDARTGKAISAVMKHNGPLQSARFSPDGRKVVTASDDRTARIWNAETGRPLTNPLENSNRVYCAEFSPDGRSVLTASSGGALVFDTETGQKRGMEAFGKNVRTACFSPDGQLIATGSSDGTAQIWNVRTGATIGQPVKHKGAILSVRFSPDQRYVVTASEDQTARVWDSISGRPVAEPLVHKGVVLSAEFSPDSRRVVTASVDCTARVWDVATGRPLTEPFREKHWVGQAQFSPDGTRIVLASSAFLARICQLPPVHTRLPEWLPDLAEAIAGEKWSDQEEWVAPERYLACRAELLRRMEMDEATRWMKWLVADRSTRPVSYASPASFIKCQPDSQAVSQGAVAVFHVDTASEAPLTCQWQFNGVDIPDATNTTFAIKSATRGDAGAYRAKIRNAVRNPALFFDSGPALLLVEAEGFSYGALRRQVFMNLTGSELISLTNNSRFPDLANRTDFIGQFEIAPDTAENYGVRLTGYLVPPKTGEYRFYLCSDNEGVLFLSPDDTSEHKRPIAHEPEWNGSRQWTATERRPKRDNVSQPIYLEAGSFYYIETLMKQGDGQDNLGVTWQMPGELPPEDLSPPIPGAYLAVPVEWLKGTPTPPASGPERAAR